MVKTPSPPGHADVQKKIPESDIQAISNVLGDTVDGLTEAEIAEVFDICRVKDVLKESTKQQRLFKALSDQQSRDGHRRSVLAVMRVAMSPERYAGDHEKFQERRVRLNEVLALCGLQVQHDGSLTSSPDASSVWLGIGSEGLIRALWRGHVPLAKTFWLFGFLGGVVLSFPGMILKESHTNVGAPFFLLYGLVLVAYGVFINISIWQSAGNYSGDKFWAFSARIFAAFSLLGFAVFVVIGLAGILDIVRRLLSL